MNKEEVKEKLSGLDCICGPLTRKAIFELGIEWVFSQPLSERLTSKEKEKIRKIYSICNETNMSDNPCLSADKVTEASSKMNLLIEIFGEEFFEV